jgi:hypothetical protein
MLVVDAPFLNTVVVVDGDDVVYVPGLAWG